jgi:hypothetical protein
METATTAAKPVKLELEISVEVIQKFKTRLNIPFISDHRRKFCLLLLLKPFVLDLLACFPSELIWMSRSYRQLVGLP